MDAGEDDGAAEMYETAMSMLDDAGYEQYEISNVCKPGRESRHNLKYWSDGEWLGFGPGAHSTWHGEPLAECLVTEDYVRADRMRGRRWCRPTLLTRDERLGDALFTGLRLNRGRRPRRPVETVWHRCLGAIRRRVLRPSARRVSC